MSYNEPITPRQLETLQQVENFLKNQCYSATIGELAAALNISRTTAYEHITALREKKLLVRSTGKARSLRLTKSGERLLEQARVCQAERCDFENVAELVGTANGVFLRGRVSAGYGIEAAEEQTPFSLPETFGNCEDIFVLQVCGHSMIDAGIGDGDFVICRSAQTAENGQIVIAMLNDEQATMKQFFIDKKAARLMPANDAFEPIYSTTCQIQAVVIGAVKRF
ncbi:MAG: repressor LexA [Planctomycetota bacterium]|nr:MAG: repressor LexA [Planctomycetota bacterium]